MQEQNTLLINRFIFPKFQNKKMRVCELHMMVEIMQL